MSPTLKVKRMTFYFTRKPGKDLPDVIANFAFTGTIPAIEQLVTNSYDADAHVVDITCLLDKDVFVIRDDGFGMDHEGLQAFFRLGDSPKKTEPVSPEGRVRLNKYGAATIVLPSLCGQYELVTVRQGVKSTVQEEFVQGEELTAKKKIKAISESAPKEKSGTTITMRKLKFPDPPHFTLDKLTRAFQWDLPIRPGFKILVNDTEIEAKSVTNATTFRLDREGKYMGHVEGFLYNTARQTKHPGIWVYVNGMHIGDPEEFLLRYVSSLALAKRIVGIINADALEPAILFDRRRFREDHKGVKELEAAIGEEILAIRREAELSYDSTRISRVATRADSFLQKTKARVMGARLGKVNKQTTFVLSDELGEDLPGEYNKSTNTLCINSRYPYVVIDSSMTHPKLEQALLGAVVDTIALTEAGKNRMPVRFLKARAEMMQKLLSVPEQDAKRQEINPRIMYSLNELARYSSYTIGAIRQLADAGILTLMDQGVVGNEFLSLQERTKGLLPLHDIVHERAKDSAAGIAESDRAVRTLDLARAYSKPFVHFVPGKDGKGYYFVDAHCADEVYDLLRAGGTLDRRKKDFNPATAFDVLRDRNYTIPILAKLLETNIAEVAQVLSYAKKEGIKIEQKNAGYAGHGTVFNFEHFLIALQARRGNVSAKP